jgi:hypothetical protein
MDKIKEMAMEILSGAIRIPAGRIIPYIPSRGAYSRFDRPKPHGGYRQIHVPCPELMLIQRRMLANLFPSVIPLPSGSLYGIAGGTSSINHAIDHANGKWLLKLDLKNAFPSTSLTLVRERIVEKLKYRVRYSHLFGCRRPNASIPVFAEKYQNFLEDEERHQKFCDSAAGLILDLTTYKGILPQGAPTSAWLFGLVANDLLETVTGVIPDGFSASMYIDNIAISGPKPILPRTEAEIAKAVKSFGYRLNSEKRHNARMKSGCRISGLSVVCGENGETGRVVLPQKTRKKIRAVLFKACTNPGLIPRALGMIAYAKSVYGHPEHFPPEIHDPYLSLMDKIETA